MSDRVHENEHSSLKVFLPGSAPKSPAVEGHLYRIVHFLQLSFSPICCWGYDRVYTRNAAHEKYQWFVPGCDQTQLLP